MIANALEGFSPSTDQTEQQPSNTGDTSQTVVIESNALFVVEFVMAGQSLIVEESGEVILRSGSATAIGNAGGNGISDVTTGVDILQGEVVPWNHLIIIPRTDGRGLYITQDAYIMVKGHYSIQN